MCFYTTYNNHGNQNIIIAITKTSLNQLVFSIATCITARNFLFTFLYCTFYFNLHPCKELFNYHLMTNLVNFVFVFNEFHVISLFPLFSFYKCFCGPNWYMLIAECFCYIFLRLGIKQYLKQDRFEY